MPLRLKHACFQNHLLLILGLSFVQRGITSTPSNVSSASIAHLPNETYVGFVQDPPGRGTSSLVLSCLLTLILCVWSALHLNVPPQGQTALETVLVNIRWIAAGIYAPELVVFTAWRQWCSARILSATVKDCQEHKYQNSLEGQTNDPRFEWSMPHSFFACTGGFAFEIESLSNVLVDDRKGEADRPLRLTLTARGVALLARCGYKPSATKEEIMDKSKANDLAKAAVVLQASWMLLQVIGRLLSRLPVTLLEVNTVAHVMCAFSMYIFWWNKPLLPNEPIIIRDESLAPLAAFMYASSDMSGYVNAENVKSQTLVKTLLANLNLFSKTPELETLSLRTNTILETSDVPSVSHNAKGMHSKVARAIETLEEQPTVCREANPARKLSHALTSCLKLLQTKREKEAGTAFFERRPRVIAMRSSGSPVSSSTAARWQLIERALSIHGTELMANNDRIALSHDVFEDVGRTGGCKMYQCIHLKPEQLLAAHIQNWPWDDLLRNVNGLVVGMILWLANLCYGGIHVAAWNDHFPSIVEKWLWRSSACYIGFCGGLWIVLNFAVAMYPPLNEFWERWIDGEKKWWQSFGLGLVVFVCGFSLVLARAYIVVEAFVSIRELPSRAYETPQWSDVFPHF